MKNTANCQSGFRAWALQRIGLPLYWPTLRFYNLIRLRWRFIIVATLVVTGLVAFCCFTRLPEYSVKLLLKVKGFNELIQ